MQTEKAIRYRPAQLLVTINRNGGFMHYYKFDISTWYLATTHLSLEEEAIYFRLLNYYYHTEQPIPKETDSVIRKLRLGSYKEIVKSILDEFFTLKGNEWHHEYCDSEIITYQNKAKVNKEVGKLGGRPKKIKELNNNPQETRSVILDNPQETLIINNKSLINNKYKPPIAPILLSEWLIARKKKPVTELVFKAVEREAKLAGISVEEAIIICCERGWISFKAEWIKSDKRNQPNAAAVSIFKDANIKHLQTGNIELEVYHREE